MEKEYVVEKKEVGLIFTFTEPRLSGDRYRLTIIDYKISGVNANSVEGIEPNKQYYNAYFNTKEKYVEIRNCKFKGKENIGIMLPDEMAQELNEIYTKLIEKRKTLVEETIINIIEGIIPIHFRFSSDMHVRYSSSVNIDKSLSNYKWDILVKAIKQLTKGDYVGDINVGEDPYRYLDNKIGYGVYSKEENNINPKAQNIIMNDEEVVAEFDMPLKNVIHDLDKLLKEAEEREKESAERKIFKESMILKILKKGTDNDGDGTDFYVNVSLEDAATHEKLKFVCRNIFDFGYVVNPDYEIVKGKKGGIENDGMWQTFEEKGGWKDIRPLTDFEKKCLNYLYKFSPIGTSIRL